MQLDHWLSSPQKTFCLIKGSKWGGKKYFKVFWMSYLLKTWKSCIWKTLSCSYQERVHIYMGGRWSNLIPCLRNLKAVVFAKWYSWKAVKNSVALDQSNNDPAGRAVQLKESPGERWELLTATEDLLSPSFTLARSAEASGAELWWKYCLKSWKGTNYGKRGELWGREGGEKTWRSLAFQRHFLSNLICCISYFWSAFFLFCISTGFHRVSRLTPSPSHWNYNDMRNLAGM